LNKIYREIVGVISEYSFAKALFEKKDLKRLRCAELVTKVPFALPDHSIDDVAILMLEQSLSALPVVDRAALILDFNHLVCLPVSF
jgi:CBS domain-containing protein